MLDNLSRLERPRNFFVLYRRGVAAPAEHAVHPRGAFLLLPAHQLLPPPGRRPGGLVWLPPVSAALPLEDDPQH